MRVYRVEIFDRNFECRSHTNIGNVDYAEDYLSLETNTVLVEQIDVNVGDYIWITNDTYSFFGIVSGVSSDSEDVLSISYQSFLSLFDTSVLFDIRKQGDKGTQTLEYYISSIISSLYILNTDQSMTIPGLTMSLSSETSKWTLGIASDDEESNYCIVNFLRSIVISAFERYSIRISVAPDIGAHRIQLIIGVNNASTQTIEADLPNITDKTVTVKENDNSVNKVVIYNSENFTDKVIYYRHPDSTFSIEDANRIVPVIQEIYAVEPTYEGDVVVETFEEKAFDQAIDAFSTVEFNNLIELTMPIDDPLNHPMSMDIGQVVNVISDDKMYSSILSGKKIGNTVTLIFGIVRVDLTKKIWRSSYGY